jgi:hypothetical protein
MTHLEPIALSSASINKGKAKEILQNVPVPSWYPSTSEDDEDGKFWSYATRDELFNSGLPALPSMPPPAKRRRRRPPSTEEKSMQDMILNATDKLADARHTVGRIHEWQRLEAEGYMPPPPTFGKEKKAVTMPKMRKSEMKDIERRRKRGGEVGEAEAVFGIQKAAGSLLGLAGFDREDINNPSDIRSGRNCFERLYKGCN